MKVLLVWDEIGLEGSCDLYLLTGLTDKDLALLDKANGKIINASEDEEAALKVWDYITEGNENSVDPNDPNNGKWMNKKLKIRNGKPIINESVNRVYMCGALA